LLLHTFSIRPTGKRAAAAPIGSLAGNSREKEATRTPGRRSPRFERWEEHLREAYPHENPCKLRKTPPRALATALWPASRADSPHPVRRDRHQLRFALTQRATTCASGL